MIFARFHNALRLTLIESRQPQWNPLPPICDAARISGAERIARAILLFYDAGEWTDDKRELWEALTAHKEATTKVLCDLARQIRMAEERESQPQRHEPAGKEGHTK